MNKTHFFDQAKDSVMPLYKFQREWIISQRKKFSNHCQGSTTPDNIYGFKNACRIGPNYRPNYCSFVILLKLNTVMVILSAATASISCEWLYQD